MVKKVPQIVITKTHLRLSFLGGGTDIGYFYRKYSGAVLSTAINKHVYVTVKRYSDLYDTNFRLNYSITENLNSRNKIKNNIIRECLKVANINFPIYVSIVSDVPAGSGLGGSSSVTVGLLNALFCLKGKKISKNKLYKLACKIEIETLKQPIGKQDQFPAVYGGMNFIEFKKNDNVIYKRINFKRFNSSLFKNSLLVWTKITRSATVELKHQKKNFNKNYKNLLNIKDNLINFKKTTNFKYVDLKLFGKFISKGWKEKSTLIRKSKLIQINSIMKKNKNQIYGAKILGAGAGGFWYILGQKNNLDNIKKHNKYSINIEIEEQGSQIICKL
jgi:D-glycero-alpha-D-manno-heptose-7-phosphate kinase